MEQAKKLINVQEDRFEQIQKAQTNYLKSPKSRVTASYVETRLETLEKIYCSFTNAHEEILGLVLRGQRSALEYFSQDKCEQLEELYTNYKSSLKEKLNELVKELTTSDTLSPSRASANTDIRLPTIQIPTFSGIYTDWPSFRDLFTSVIHKNTSLDDVQKLHYLKSLVSGEAAQLLRSITITNENYTQAWGTLFKRFNNKRYIANHLFKRLFALKPLTQESGHLLKQLLDTTSECLSSLKNIGIKTETWDDIIVYLTVTKLDPTTHRLWEQHISAENDDMPSLQQLSQFLEVRFRSLEMIEDQIKPHKSKTFHATASGSSLICTFCSGDHYIFQCKEFVRQGLEQRTEFVKSNNLCFNCLIPNHCAKLCLRNTSCNICKRKHHSLLHPGKSEARTVEQPPKEDIDNLENKDIATHFVSQPGQVLLATALVDVSWKNGYKHIYRALLDQGSQASFVTEDLVQSAGLKRVKVNGEISGLSNGSKLRTKYVVELELRSRIEPQFTMFVRAYVLKKITNYLPSQRCTVTDWPEFKSIALADPEFNVPNNIDILLGAEAYAEIIDDGLLKSSAGAIAQKTRLGWILSGKLSETLPKIVINMHVCDCDNKLLRRFWEIENDTNISERKHTKEEIQCERIYKNTTVKTKDNKYKVYLPFKEGCENPVEKCGETREIAISRFLQLERRFKRDDTLKREYTKVIHEYLDLSHMELVNTDIKQSIYLPHHAVIRNDKDTTKTRIVFDASAKGSKGCSLNDTLLIGPTLQGDLRTLILQWRQYAIVLASDLIKMYRQVLVTEEHTDYQRIIWRDNQDEELKSYRLLTVTFGTAAAPYLAVRTLLQTAEDGVEEFPLAAEITKTSFYMDDLLTGCYSVDEGVKIYNEMNSLLKTGGFELRKWCSNSNELLARISENKPDLKETYEIKFDQIIKILGLTWDRNSDIFKFSVNLPPIEDRITKRKILSDIARLFDPFGWLAPVIVTAKIFLQRLWLMSIEWDEPLPLNVVSEWIGYRNELIKLENIEINRCINTYQIRTNVELHGFSDASTAAYAAVVYVKTIGDHGNLKITLLESKTKVAPLKQISVARLELCGALLLAKMLSQAAINLKIPMEQVFAYTDSTVALAWIEGQPIKWQTFVANRVTEIQTLLDNSVWRFVSSKDNPADLASRGIQAEDLVVSTMWWQGPTWLKEKQKYKQINTTYTTTLEERKHGVKTFLCEIKEKPIVERFSTLNKMKRVLTYCRRFLLWKPEKKYTDYITTEELNETMRMCIKLVQKQEFREEIKDLTENGMVKKRSKLKTLSPYLDENKILRVGGRLQGAMIGSEIKHPILLPKNNHLTSLVVRDAHIKSLHGGNRLMTNYLQNQYWIIGLKPLVKKCVRECVVCVRHKGIALQPKMGELPSVRITPGRPFKTSGVDFAGPIQLHTSKGRGYKSFKGYICLFICMKTKAVHLEVVSDLTSKGFIAAFKRFTSRRGHCSDIWSDNGLNFVGAAKELKDNAKMMCLSGMKDIVELLANEGTIWHFIPPRAPNFGGLWEAAVKSAKTHLVRVVGNSTLTFEELTTLLSQVEACLNSRPLCQLNDHPDDVFPLTPAHFLIGEPTMIIPEPDYENVRISALDRWTLVQKMTQHFWKRWSTEYLQELQKRQKWQNSSMCPDVGQLVIVKDIDSPPAKWLLGRVLDLIPGPDKAVRVVKLKCKSSILTRPISKLILLPRDITLHETAQHLMVGGKNNVLGGRNVGAVSASP